MKKTRARCVLFALLSVCSSGALVRAQNPSPEDYALKIFGGSCSPGEMISASVVLDFPNGLGLAGVSFGVCHGASVDIDCNDCVSDGTIVPGRDLSSVCGGLGPEFFAVGTTESPEPGFTAAIVVGSTCESLPPQSYAELVTADYQCVNGGWSTLRFCETGDPLVSPAVSLEGGFDLVPETSTGWIYPQFPQDPLYTVKAGHRLGPEGGTVGVSFFLDFPDGLSVSGVSFGACHDPGLVSLDCSGGLGHPNDCVDNGVITMGSSLHLLCGRDSFFAPETSVFPHAGFGVGLGVGFLCDDQLLPASDAELVVANYRCLATGQTPITICETGDPLRFLSVGISGGGDLAPLVEDGSIEIVSSRQYIRGDANGNGTLNGLVDALFIFDHVFSEGPAPRCLESADSDDDAEFNGLTDTLYILNYQFLGGPPPAVPFPSCGYDSELETSLGCESSPVCP